MADTIEHLMLEQFRRVREDIRQLTEAVGYIHKQQLADRHGMRGMQLSLDSANELLTSLTGRVARIERRLELTDDPSPAGFADDSSPFEPRHQKRGPA
jgi:hypothetical protein